MSAFQFAVALVMSFALGVAVTLLWWGHTNHRNDERGRK